MTGHANANMNQDEGVSRRTFLFGAAGTTVAATGTAAAQQNNSSGGGSSGNQSAGSGNQSGNASGGGAKTVSKTVATGPNGNFTFEPSQVVVTPGSTVTWKWKSDNHNIVVSSQPDGANWKGTPGPPSKTYNEGYSYKHTFKKKGTYEYFCQPHKAQGMVGSVQVKETLPTPESGGGGGGGQPSVPNSAKSLGIASGFGIIATLGLSFFFLKYGGDYEPPE